MTSRPLVKEAPCYSVAVFIAGDHEAAVKACREYCDRVGLCVTVTPTTYVYTDGQEEGVIVGLINYPRFPKLRPEIWNHAVELGEELRGALGQQSFTIDAADGTTWISWRDADAHSDDCIQNAACGESYHCDCGAFEGKSA